MTKKKVPKPSGEIERRKSDAERKTLIIPVRANAQQKRVLEKKAKARGIGLSTWLLQLGLAAPDIPTGSG